MRKTVRIGLAVAAILFVLVLGVFWASQRAPEFYTRALVKPPAEQKQASDEMLQNASALAGDVQREGRWDAVFTQSQINGWLAVDLVENHTNSLPPGVSDPRVGIAPGRATLACRYSLAGVSTILNVELEIYMPEPTIIAVRILNARAGAIPIPLKGVLESISKGAVTRGIALQWSQIDGDPVALVTIPPGRDKDTIYRFEVIELREGEIFMSGRTERIRKGAHQGAGGKLTFIPMAAYPMFGENVKRY